MTTTYKVPKRVAENIAKRHAADTHATRCIYGCRAHARLYPCGARCDEHSPWYLAGQPDPDTQIDPARTVDGLRARRGDEPETVRAIRARIQPAPTDSLTERFLAFDAANPHVRERLVELVEWHVSQGARLFIVTDISAAFWLAFEHNYRTGLAAGKTVVADSHPDDPAHTGGAS